MDMNNKTQLLFLPLFSSLIWIAVISAGTHLHLIEFSAEDESIPLGIGSYIFSFTIYFYALLAASVFLCLFGMPFSTNIIKIEMFATALMLLLVTIFPGTKSGSFLKFDTRDLVMIPAWTAYGLLAETGVIREGEIPDSRTVEKLIEALNSRNTESRWKTVKALGARRDKRAVEPLIALLSEENSNIRSYAADALGRINDPRAIKPLVTFWKGSGYIDSKSAEEALLRIDNPLAVNQLIAVLEDKDIKDLHKVAAKSLGKIGDRRAVAPLIATLASKVNDKEVIEALGEIGDPRAAIPLIATLKKYKIDTSYSADELCNATIEALGKIRNPVAVKPLIAMLKDEEKSIRKRAIESLGEIGDSRAVEHIIRFLKDEDSDMREVAAHALGNINDPRAAQPMIDVLQKSNHSSFRKSVVLSLGQIDDPRAVATLIAVLEQDESDEVRQMAAYRLGKSGNSQALVPLVAALKEGSVELRAFAARSLGKLNDTRAIEPLVAAQNDAQRSVAWQATLSLENFNDPKSTAAVEGFLSRSNLLNVAKNYVNIIRKGSEKNEFTLIFALKRHGTEQMAQDFVTSKHWMLSEQGELWLKNHGLKPNRNPRPDAPEWDQKSSN